MAVVISASHQQAIFKSAMPGRRATRHVMMNALLGQQ